MSQSLSPFAYKDFRIYMIARFIASMAIGGMIVIIGWQVYDVARSDYGMSPKEAAFQLGLLGLVQFVPFLIMSPIAGWTADRFERRTVVRCAQSVDGLIALILALCTTWDVVTLPLLFGLAALNGVVRVFVGPALSAISPNIIPEAVRPRAVAASSMAMQMATIIGPAAAGFLYAGHPSAPYWCAVALLLLANIALGQVMPVYPPPIAGDAHPFRQMIDGLLYVRKERFLMGAMTLDLFAVLLGGATALLPVYARDILHVGPEGLGQLRAAPALGSAIIALWMSFRPLKSNVGVKMLYAVAVYGAATIAFGVSTSFLLSLAMLALLGAADMFSVFVRIALVQLNTPDTMRGRVGSVSGVAISASNELGELQSGIAASLLGPVGAVVFGGVGAILITGLWAWLFPELKNAKSFEPEDRQTAA
jgi:MFS family permease